jgi:cohesin domain-containing protein
LGSAPGEVKMKGKKFGLVVFAGILAGFFAGTASAVTLTVGDKIANLNQTIQVPVTVDDPSAIAGAAFTITYNTTDLNLSSIDNSFFDSFEKGDQIPGTGTMVSGANPESGTTNTTLMILNFSVSGSAKGDYPINITQSTISNTSAGYDPGGESVPMLMGADPTKSIDPYDPDAYPDLSPSVASGTLSIDRDNDGLKDIIEDPDSDGWDQGTETNLNNPDTDGDGLTDGQEVNGGVRNPLVKDNTFDADSNEITNTYIPLQAGHKLTYAGTGSFDGYGRYIEPLGTEVVDSVNCLKILIKGHANNPDPDLDTEWYYFWVAQDTDDVLWVFKIYDAYEDTTATFEKDNAVVWMPADPVVGQVFAQMGDEYQEVVEKGVEVPQLTTGLGPYTDCLKVKWSDGETPADEDYQYHAPNVGIVKEEWDDGGTNGWDLGPSDGIGDELAVDFGATYGLWIYDSSWTKVSALDAEILEDYGLSLVADFGFTYGLWLYDGSWTQISLLDAQILEEYGNSLAADFGATGLWTYNGAWTRISTLDAQLLQNFGNSLAADFGVNGLWIYNGTWTRISTLDAQLLQNFGNSLAADFGVNGLWIYNGTWTKISALDSEGLQNFYGYLAADFGANGLWIYDGAWTKISALDEEEMTDVNVYP